MSEPPNQTERFYPIRTVARMTGVNPVTLRAWERRHGLIKPTRTPKGHRVYTNAHIELIRRIVALLDAGMSIGQVGPVLETDPGGPEESQPATMEPWTDYRQEMISALVHFDGAKLNAIYSEAISLYPIDIVTSKLIVPLLKDIGFRWQEQSGSVAEEHFFSVFLRNKLGARLHHRALTANGPQLVCACLPGEHHETGILLFALAAVDFGYRTILLGANLPLTELPLALDRSKSSAIVLAGSAEPAGYDLAAEIKKLVQATDAPIFVGGRVSLLCRNEIVDAGAMPLGDDIGAALQQLSARIDR